MTDVAIHWRRLCRDRLASPTRRELATLARLAEEHGAARTAWAMALYEDETMYPEARDFARWMADYSEDLPSELVCRAYLTHIPEVVALANEVETLRAAWFPTYNTAERVIELETQLERVLL